jgi:DNA-binding YbaB/EbfC family protein
MDMNEILKKAQQMQSEIKKNQEQSKSKEYQGSAGGDMVKVIINGLNETKKIAIDSVLLVAEEKDILEDLLIAAFNDAIKKAKEDTQGTLKNIAGSMGIPDNLF